MPTLRKPPTVLVTGAGGWLGGRLVDALVGGLKGDSRFGDPSPGMRIRAMGTRAAELAAPNGGSAQVEWVLGDIRRPEDCAKFVEGARGALLIHAAGIIHPRRVVELDEVNHRGTETLLREAAKGGIRRAVVVSSNSPIGVGRSREDLFDERSPYRPYMAYGRSKMGMEQAVHRIQQGGILETVIIRPPWFYGPFQPPRQTLFFQMIRDGKAPLCGDGLNRRSMVYIDNLCQGVLLAGTAPRANGETYWIADERPYTIRQVLDTVERLLEVEFGITVAHRRRHLPSAASEVARAIDTALQACGLYHQKIHVLSEWNKTIACSIAKAKEQLEYRPQVALEEGMRRSIQWCIDEGLLATSRRNT